MDVVVVGGHGKVALALLQILAQRGDRARGLIRERAQAPDLEAVGAEAMIADLERDEIPPAIGDADAVVFAAGAGAGSGPERKRTVDLGGALKLIVAVQAAGIRRYVMISAMGAAAPPAGSEGMAPYLQAEAEADQALAHSGLDFTIVRPGALTDDAGTGHVEVSARLGHSGSIAREDVALTLCAVLHEPATIAKTFEVVAGERTIDDALRTL